MTTADGTATARAADDGPPAAGGPYASWDRVVVWWDAAFYALLTLCAVSLALTDVAGPDLALALGCVAVIAVAYAVVGARAARTREVWRARAYLTVLVGATAAAATTAPVATLLLFVTFTHVWMLSEHVLDGVVFSALVCAGVTLAVAAGEGWSVPVLLEVAPQMGVAFVFAVGLGLWVARTMRQSEVNARLVDRLRAAQAELAASQHAAGVAAERERLAREIHDTLAQGFTSVVMQAQVAAAALDRGDEATVRERLATLEATARDNLAEARGLVAAFSPVPLHGATLADALDRLGRRWSAETGVPVRVETADVGPLGPQEEVVLLRSAQEALANVRRHAGARTVVVRLTGGGGAPVALEVLDDGQGIAPGTEEGFGLRGMRERVSAGGGTVAVGPGSDGGTAVRVLLPARAPQAGTERAGAGAASPGTREGEA
ncbi:sensor histidine kinase [Xylanimonas oleitrophica]|uniref:histidine kinase n=1 Tax=Xylanimonas oleitrophica TaxID=2607479 RepID=A0A2W5X371_9MICO|nr:sensor histidine kinase [Xylanimonas oleitrophica]PZR54845.1 sensor histidine kinase [Xylanimonas oleitrophica]